MKSSLPFVIICILLFSVSCKSTYNEITEDELLEWQVYQFQEQLIFMNSYGQTDTFIISSVLGGYEKDGDTYNETVKDIIIKLNDSITENNTGLYLIKKDGSNIEVSLKWPHHAVTKNITSSPKIPLYVFNGDTLNNVCLSVVPSIFIDSTNAYIDSVYFSKTLGVFKYTDIYNNTWTKTN